MQIAQVLVAILLLINSGKISQGDTMDSLLSIVHQSKSDLGYRPKSYWLRYPNPALIPYKIPAFDDLFANPLMIYEYTRTMGNVVTDYLGDSLFNSNNFILHRLVYFLGVDRKITGFRNYSTNLNPRICESKPLLDALKRLREITGVGMNSLVFGGQYGSDSIPGLGKIPPEFRIPLAKLILNVIDAYKWWETATRNLKTGAAARLVKIDPSLLGQDNEFHPEFDDVYSSIDEHSLYYSAMKLADASEKCARALDSIISSKKVPDFIFRWNSPIGEIIIAGSGDDTFRFQNAPLIYVNLSGNDVVYGPLGAGIYPQGISVALDIRGNDKYFADSSISQGAGFVGNGVLIDWSGNDEYWGENGVQGMGIIGLGLIFDNEGDDFYHAALAAQGEGVNGIGMLIDRNGNDNYYLYGLGQGAGLAGGIGVLADRYGNDSYTAEPYSGVVNLGDYHSKFKINANAAQGYGGGRRADGSDGHSYAGGLGALLDASGNDVYVSGNWTLGIGYWYGIGLVWDGAGDDLYRSCYFTQGSGAHYSIGALIDEAGNDRHELFETAGAALGFGWDFVDALLFDRSGNDFYSAKIISMGVAEIRSNAFFIDLQGNDEYIMNEKTLKFGAADFRKSYKTPNRYSPFAFHASEFGIFIDGGGKDKYKLRSKDGEFKKSKIYKNDSIWLQPDSTSTKFGFKNYGLGADVEKGFIREFKEF